ncbi:perlucin-like [Haliotis rufescens]|uniref:perlucin-like n=1 Tax=Haliotis rufescens TaxID=6454 RepID=UPI001EAFBA1C|nr:perlucin-like [Haliotis rufescens]XP_048257559.1 perlucin-like [Haliotis rufescens]
MLCAMEAGFIILVLTYFVTGASPSVKSGFGNKWESFTNIIIPTDILSEVSDILSRVTCVSLCLKDEACVSVFYRQQHRRCQLHDVVFLSPQDGQQETGTVYYSLTAGACPSGYVHNRLLNFCYQLHLDKLLYDVGLADCTARGEHFVVIDSADKQNHVVKQITSSSDSNVTSYYFDGSDATNEGQWVFHDGRPMTYFAWSPSFPVNLTYRHYVVASKVDNAFQWQDRKRAETKYYICEKDI